MAVAAVLLFYLCRQLSLPSGLSLVTGIASGLSPGMFELTLYGMGGDVLYAVLLLATVLVIFVRRENLSYRTAILVGSIFGLATWIRPVGVYIAPVICLGLVVFAITASLSKRKSIGLGLLAFVTFWVVLLPWYVRNEVQTGHFFISSIPAYNFTYYNVPDFFAYQRGTTRTQELPELFASLGNPSLTELPSYTMTDTLTAYDRAFLKQHFFAYVPFHIIKSIPFFLSSALSDDATLLRQAGFDVPFIRSSSNLTSLLLRHDFKAIAIHLAAHWPFTLESIMWAVLFLGAFLAPFLARDRQERLLLVLGIMLILASAAVTGPVALSRYRVPIEPYVWLGVAYTLWWGLRRHSYFSTSAS